MKQCPNCHSMNPDDAVFCHTCRKNVVPLMRTKPATISDTWKFIAMAAPLWAVIYAFILELRQETRALGKNLESYTLKWLAIWIVAIVVIYFLLSVLSP
jgi:hypothetical protein